MSQYPARGLRLWPDGPFGGRFFFLVQRFVGLLFALRCTFAAGE